MVPFWQVILYLEKGSILAGNTISRDGFHFGRLYFIYRRVPFWQVTLYLENGSILAGNTISREWFHFGW